MEKKNQWLEAKWPSPHSVRALTTKRLFWVDDKLKDFNLALHAGLSIEQAEINRALLQRTLGLEQPVTWLNQVHKADVVMLPQEGAPQADAVITTNPNEVCAVLTADCLPIVLCDKEGQVVAAIHGGWRSLNQNIIQNTIESIRKITKAPLMAWFGPSIAPEKYEIASEVKEAFLQNFSFLEKAFKANPHKSNHHFLDLYGAAKLLLNQGGVHEVYGGGHCTFTESHDFYSYRRDPQSGRMATLIWKTE